MTDTAETRQIFVRAVDGRRVLKPGTREPIGAEGEWVEYSPFWLRRLNDGDVVKGTPKALKSAAAKSSKE